MASDPGDELDEAMRNRDIFRAEKVAREMIISDPDDWRPFFALGMIRIGENDCRRACIEWIDSFKRMPAWEFDDSFRKVADHLERYISESLWRSIEELKMDGLDDLAYSIFLQFPERRCEDTDLLVVLLKRLNLHIADMDHLGYLSDLVDAGEMIARMHIDMNVEIRTHMYVSDLMLGLCSSAIMRSLPMIEASIDIDEKKRVMSIIGEVSSLFTMIRDFIHHALGGLERSEVDEIVRGWSGRCISPYMEHLDRAFELSMIICGESQEAAERLQCERDSAVEMYVTTYFRGH